MAAITWEIKADLDYSGTFATDLLPYLDAPGERFSVQHGAGIDGRPLTSEVSLRLRNASGVWSPRNSASALYGSKSRLPVRIKATHNAVTYDVWKGYVVSGRWQYPGLKAQSAGIYEIRCQDLLALIAQQVASVSASTSYDIDGAVGDVLLNTGLSAGDFDVSNDSPELLQLYFTDERSVNVLLGELVTCEMGGALYSATNGKPFFEPRTYRLGTTLEATPPANVWGQGTAIVPTNIEEEERDEDLVTKVEVSPTKYVIGTGGIIFYDSGFYPTSFGGPAKSMAPIEVYGPISFGRGNMLGVVGLAPGASPTCTIGIDLVATQNADGSGSDRSNEFTIDFTLTDVDGWTFRIVNTSATNTSYIVRFVIRGVAITDGSGSVAGVSQGSTPTTANDATAGTTAWTNPTNAQSSNDTYATVAPGAGVSSQYLTAKSPGVSIPSNSIVQGILVEVEGKTSSGSSDISARIIRQGTISTDETPTGTLGTTENYVGLGGPTFQWAREWTPADINGASFGVALFIASAPGGVTYSIDHVRMTVFYTTQTGVAVVTPKYMMELPIPNLKGGRKLSVTFPWIQNDNKVRDYGYQLLRTQRYPLGRLRMRFALKNDSTREAILGAKPGKLIQWVSPTAVGVHGDQSDDHYRVESRQLDISPGGNHWATISLIPSYQYRNLDAIVWDDFNRADHATALGNTPTGKTWTIDSGSWQLLTKKARPTSTAQSRVWFDVGKSSVIAEVSLSNMSADADEQVGLLYRFSDSNNYWIAIVQQSANNIIISKKVAGASTNFTAAYTPVDVAELRLIVQGNRHRLWVNRNLVLEVASDSALNTNTKVGFYAAATTVVDFDNVYAQGLIA